MKAGEELELRAEDLAYGGGETTAHAPDGRVVFTPGLAPGDLARVEVVHVRPRWARARLVEVVSPGPGRVAPRCEAFGRCGGCQWQHVALADQREAKARIVRHLLEPLGAADHVAAIRGEGDGWGWRNRLILPVRAGRGGPRAGFFRADSHVLVESRDCPVQRPGLWGIARTALGLASAAGIPGYDERLDTGVLRHLLVRSTAEGEAGVVFVTATPDLPGGEEIAGELRRISPAVAAVAHNVNPGRTNVVVGPETRCLAGRGWLEERVGTLAVRSSLTAFFQANPAVAAIMADLVAGWTRDTTGGILDLYAGAGVLGLTAAAGSRAAWLAGIEESPAAVEDARGNAAAVPGVPSEWHAGDVESVLPAVAGRLGRPECVIVDPPRKGLAPGALAAAAALRAPVFIYVSCDPATFARDVKALQAAGYSVREVVPLDMFPQTWHIELAARLTIAS